MADFTPKPWKVVKVTDKPARWIFADGWRLATIHYRQRPAPNGFLPSEADPNAHLMAAAPSMYARMHNALASLSKGTSEGVREAIEELQAGLALADGKGDSDE